jgi:NAD(P)H-hydrate epimerase
MGGAQRPSDRDRLPPTGNAAARTALELAADATDGPVAVCAGDGGNGGGLCAARHLLNRSRDVRVVLDRPAADLTGAAARQWRILDAMGVEAVTAVDGAEDPFADAALVVDALVGYGITGALRGRAADPDRTLTLALPKTGLEGRDGLVLADIGLPRTVFERAGVDYPDPGPFGDGYRVRLETGG